MRSLKSLTSNDIRYACPGDAPRICEIYNQAIHSRMSTCDLEPLPVSDIDAWFDGRDFATRPIYIAEIAGTIAGYLSVSNFWNDRPGYRVTADCGVYIDATLQGRGVGSALLQRFLDDAASLGIHTIVTSMFADNASSVALFEKFGFSRVGVCSNVANLEGAWKDLAIVERTVQPL